MRLSWDCLLARKLPFIDKVFWVLSGPSQYGSDSQKDADSKAARERQYAALLRSQGAAQERLSQVAALSGNCHHPAYREKAGTM